VAEKVWTAKEIERLMVLAQDVVSLNEIIKLPGDTDGEELGTFIEDPESNPINEVINTDRHNILMRFIKQYLRPNEQDIIIARFGLETGYPMTLDEIGKSRNITRERVRQVEATGLRRLRLVFMKKQLTEEDF
jgi:RNA polymerase primary sigma factor